MKETTIKKTEEMRERLENSIYKMCQHYQMETGMEVTEILKDNATKKIIILDQLDINSGVYINLEKDL